MRRLSSRQQNICNGLLSLATTKTTYVWVASLKGGTTRTLITRY